jgi:hypothetical protein
MIRSLAKSLYDIDIKAGASKQKTFEWFYKVLEFAWK